MNDRPDSNAVEDLLATVRLRGAQYGTEDDPLNNLRASQQFGVDPLTGVLVRMGDKWARIVNMTNDLRAGRMVDPVQLRDQLLDNAGYSIKAMELLDERFGPVPFERATEQSLGQPPAPDGEDTGVVASIGRWLRSLSSGDA
jgi:hypothetical protein